MVSGSASSYGRVGGPARPVVTSLAAHTDARPARRDARGRDPAEHRRGADRRHAGRRAALPARRTTAPALRRDLHPGPQRRLAVLPGPGDPAHRQAGAQPPDHRQRRRRRHGGYPVFAAAQRPRATSCRSGSTTGLPDGLDRQVPQRDSRARTTSASPTGRYFAVPVHRVYDYRASRFAINGRFHTDDRLPRDLHAPACSSRGCAPGPAATDRSSSSTARWRRTRPGPARRAAAPAGGAGESIAASTPRPPARRPSVGRETDLSDKPAWLQAVRRDARAHRPTRCELETHRVEALLSVNDTVRDLVATLERLHELNDTIVVFTSDNGYMLHEHDAERQEQGLRGVACTCRSSCAGPGFRGGDRGRRDGEPRRRHGDDPRARRCHADRTEPTGSRSRTCWRTRRRSTAVRSRSRGRRRCTPARTPPDRRDRTVLHRCGVGSLLLRPLPRPATASSTTGRSTPGSWTTPTCSTRLPAARRRSSRSGTTTTSTAEAPPATTGSRLADRPGRDAPPPTPMAVPDGSASRAPGCSLD